ncbi:hypothetical protein ACIOGZ_28365 [Kitasatospora sp. NPDC088160]|uniref:hypothetical protein n=1 Tax=Kitasatospora sp. NPDC088160 TaxID=3364072 RepID=UPI0037F49CBB
MGREKSGKPLKVHRITEPAAGPGASPQPFVVGLEAQAARIPGAGAAIIMIQPTTVAHTALDGTLLSADVNEFVVRAYGARRLTLPITPDPVDHRWRASLKLTADGRNELLIGAENTTVYDGTMPVPAGWTELVAAAGATVLLITGPIKTLNDFDAVLRAGRASQVTIPLTITR